VELVAPDGSLYKSQLGGVARISLRVPDDVVRSRLLSYYGPAALLLLAAIWLVLLLVAWSMLYWPMRCSLADPTLGCKNDYPSYLDVAYYSGVTLFTIGFGDFVGHSAGVRFISLAEAASGLATLSLFIGFLPALYAGYSRREERLISLDDGSGTRLAPAHLIAATFQPTGDVEALFAFFAGWQMWMSSVLETHVAYPMLTLFRSRRHMQQHWLNGIAVVSEAAALVCAVVEDGEFRDCHTFLVTTIRALREIRHRLGVREVQPTPLTRREFGFAYQTLATLGLPLRSEASAWREIQRYWPQHKSEVEALADYLLLPPGFASAVTEPIGRFA